MGLLREKHSYKQVMSSFDVYAITLELKQKVIGKHIDNIYQLDERTFLIKIRPGDLNLIVEAERRIHLTAYQLKTPPKPANLCMALRKHLAGGKIIDVYQHEFERIVIIVVAKGETCNKLVVEAFPRGNLIVVDQNEEIMLASRYARMRDRNILRGEAFKQPPSTGLSLITAKKEDLVKLREQGELKALKALKELVAVGETYAKEILFQAGIDWETHANKLSDAQMEALSNVMRNLASKLTGGKLKPCIVLDAEGAAIDVTPFQLDIYKRNKLIFYPSFNEAADEYFTKKASTSKTSRQMEVYRKRLEELRRIQEMQLAKLNELQKQTEENQAVGNVISTHHGEIEQLLRVILEAEGCGKDWAEAVQEVIERGRLGRKPEAYVENFDRKTGTLNMSIEGISFTLGLRRHPIREAARFYEEAKKARSKLSRLEAVIEKTKMKMSSAEKEVFERAEEKLAPTRRRVKEWYEKFRWFRSSEDFLVLVGRDASTNELLVKKYTEPHDVVLHSEAHGAPFVVVKSMGKTVGEQTLAEASQAAVSYSGSWARGHGSADAFWVKPSQVSKSAPSGEYLAKGMFMIRGTKNIFRGVPLKLAVGIVRAEDQIQVLGGSTASIRSRTPYYVEIVPGKTPSGKLAKEIVLKLMKKVPSEWIKLLKQVSLEEFQRFIPSGKGGIQA